MISIYYKEIYELNARVNHVYRTTSKDRLKKAQKFGQHEKSLPKLKVAFIPKSDQQISVKFRKNGDLYIKSKYINTNFIEFDKHELIKDPFDHAKEKISKSKAKTFVPLCGKYEYPRPQSKETLPESISFLTSKYGDSDKNNYFGNWLIGVATYEYNKQKDFTDYYKAKQKAKNKKQKSRELAKRRLKYARSKK